MELRESARCGTHKPRARFLHLSPCLLKWAGVLCPLAGALRGLLLAGAKAFWGLEGA